MNFPFCGLDPKLPSRRRESGSLSNAYDRRSRGTLNQAVRMMTELLVKTDLKALERVMLGFIVALDVGIAMLGSSLIATPPPLFQKYALVLPTWCWCALLTVALFWQVFGMWQSKCVQANGACVLGLVICCLCGPLFIRGPVIGCIVVCLMIGQMVVAARLFYKCHRAKIQGCG